MSSPALSSPTLPLSATLTCPACGHQQTQPMPTDACQFFYECQACLILHKPRAGDCCVFCSYGTAACPPRQMAEGS